MISMRSFTLALVLSASVILGPSRACAQEVLGWSTFDYGVSGTLGSTISPFDGALAITGRVGLLSRYAATSGGVDGTASSLEYLHDDNWLVGGIATSPGGIRGNAGYASELIFDLRGQARLDSIALTISGLSFGAGIYDQGYNLTADDPMLWLNTSSGIFTITEEGLSEATSFFLDGTTAGAENGYVDFAYFTAGLGVDTTVTSFGLRETHGDIWVKDLYIGDFTAAPVPEPGSAILLATGVLCLLRRRRRAPHPLSCQLAVV